MRAPSLNLILALSMLPMAAWSANPPIPATVPPAPAATPSSPNQVGPRIAFSSPIHDFGKINAGDVAKCDFVFTNTGDALLEITDVRPSCGCTTAGQWTRQVEPGKTGTIPLQFNSANFSGPVTKTATVTCNDPSHQTTILQLKSTIWRPIEVTPQFAIINLTTESPSNAATVRIVNHLDQPLILKNIDSKNPVFAAELKTIVPDKEFQLVIKTVPPFPSGNVQGQITLQTSSSNMPVITVTAWANVQHTVMAMPAQIALPAGPLDNKLTQTVWVRNNGSNDISLSEPAINVDGATVDLKDFQKGRYFQLTLTFPPGLLLSQNQHPELTIKTSHPSYPLIKVPVIQQQRPTMPYRPAMTPKPVQPQPAVPIGANKLPTTQPLRRPTLIYGPPAPPPKPATTVRPPAPIVRPTTTTPTH